jgi:hypothetical protein
LLILANASPSIREKEVKKEINKVKSER